MKYKVEVAILFSNHTWDTVWVNEINAVDESAAKEAAEEIIKNAKNALNETIAHTCSLTVQQVEGE